MSWGSRRLSRLADELDEVGLTLDPADPLAWVMVREIDHALHPPVHEHRVPSFGAFVGGVLDERWEAATGLRVVRRDRFERTTRLVRSYADGTSGWINRSPDGPEGVDEWIVLDRPAGSERDLVLMAEAARARAVQRHPSGVVRIAESAGVLRWNGLDWHREPPVASWMHAVDPFFDAEALHVLDVLLSFAVHDLGSQGVGALLVFGWDGVSGLVERRLEPPPGLCVTTPSDLAALRHLLAHLDGAAVFDDDGMLVQMGARLVPSPDAERIVPGHGGMRHTSARRFSHDAPDALVIVVSDDGPVTLFRAGEPLARSGPGTATPGPLDLEFS